MAESEAPYRFEEADDHCTIVLKPELNKAPWGEIDSIGSDLLERKHARMDGARHMPAFIVDLSTLNYMGSAMVALVVRLWKAAKEKNAKMAVINDDEQVLEVLQLAGLSQVWTIVESREEARKALGISDRKPQPEGVATTNFSTSETAASPGNAMPWIVATVVLLVIAGVGLFLFTADPAPVEDFRIPLALLFGGATLGLITATAATALGTGLPRAIGAGCLLGMLALLAAGVIAHPHRDQIFEGRNKDFEGVANPKEAKPANREKKTTPHKGAAVPRQPGSLRQNPRPEKAGNKPTKPSNSSGQPAVAPRPGRDGDETGGS